MICWFLVEGRITVTSPESPNSCLTPLAQYAGGILERRKQNDLWTRRRSCSAWPSPYRLDSNRARSAPFIAAQKYTCPILLDPGRKMNRPARFFPFVIVNGARPLAVLLAAC